MFALVLGFFAGFSNVDAADCSINNSCGNGSPELVVNIWGTSNSQLPHIMQGQTKTLINGTSYTCPVWFPMHCVDISGTAWFRSR